MTKKYSSFTEHQLITESFREFLLEQEEDLEEGLIDKVKAFFSKSGAQPMPIFGKRGIKHLKNGTFVDDYTEEDDDKAETAAIAATQALWDKDNGESYRSWAAEQLATRYASELAKIDYKPSISLRSDFGQMDPEIVSKVDIIWSKGAKGKKAAVRDYQSELDAQAREREEEQESERRARERERRGRSLSPEEKKRAAQKRAAKERSRLADKEQEVLGYKDKRVGNVGSASSGFAGRSGKLREQDNRMTSADYQKSVRDDRGRSGVQSGIDDIERKVLALLQQKVSSAAAAGDIKTGVPARLIKALGKELDKILAKKK
jgi:hypothetical protein